MGYIHRMRVCVCVETLEDVAECETTRISQHLITACGVRGQSRVDLPVCVCVCVWVRL